MFKIAITKTQNSFTGMEITENDEKLYFKEITHTIMLQKNSPMNTRGLRRIKQKESNRKKLKKRSKK